MVIRTREVSWGTVGLFLLAMVVLLVAIWEVMLTWPGLVRAVHRSTAGLLNFNLLAGAALFLGVVGGILFGHGRLRPAELGLSLSRLGTGVAVTAGLWVAVQVTLAALVWSRTGDLALRPVWTSPGALPAVGFLIAMLAGTPLVEEIGFRGFLFPQLVLKLGGPLQARIWRGILASSLLFAFCHLPRAFMVGIPSERGLPSALLGWTVAGVFFCVLYLRTANLFVVTGVHALSNAPTQLFGPYGEARVLVFAYACVIAVLWGRMARRAPTTVARIERTPPPPPPPPVEEGRGLAA